MILELKNTVQKTVMTGVMAAVLAVLSQISIPLPSGVPITLQTFAVALGGYLLGPAFGSAAVGVYLILGAIGLPVFAGFSGGLGSFVGITGGFLWSFLPMALLCGLGARSGKKAVSLALGLAGLAICHLAGCFQFAGVANAPFSAAFFAASFPFLVKDVISVALAYLASAAVAAALKKSWTGGTV